MPSDFVINFLQPVRRISHPVAESGAAGMHTPREILGMTRGRPRPIREPIGRRPRPVHDARLLTAGGTEAEIRLDGVRYVLRITRQGKLILTK